MDRKETIAAGRTPNPSIENKRDEKGSPQMNGILPRISSLLISLAVLLLLIFTSGFIKERGVIPPPTDLQNRFPKEIGSYQSASDAAIDQEVMNILELTDYLNRTYITPDGHSVHLYVGYVKSQDKGPLIHTPVGCLPGGGKEITKREVVPWWRRGEQGIVKNVNLLYLVQGQETQLVVYWYQERGRIIHNDWIERFYLFEDSVLTGRTDGALVRFISGVAPGESKESAKERLRRFVQLAIPALDGLLPGKSGE